MSASTISGRVTKNAVALAFRMILVTLVGLYTSRVILEAMGVDDFGIYGVIGGVVGLAAFLNTCMGGATSRFITFELGRKNEELLKQIFSTSIIIHLFLAILVLILAETVGLWFVNTQMNFPPHRMVAVNVLYQLTILTMIVNFTQVPYTATILAHENMGIYAYLEIVNASLKLGAVYLVIVFKWDKLILYALLVFFITTLISLLYRFYCVKHFPEAKIRLQFNKDIIRKMMSFFGADLYGNMCGAVRYQGIPLILNFFFGVVANAGSTIAMSVAVAMKGLTSSVSQAYKPQIIKQYASRDIPFMGDLMSKASQFTLVAFAAVGIPVFFEAHGVLRIWLGQVPPYSVEFLRLILIMSFIEICTLISNVGVHATGKIKTLSVINGTIYLMCPLISYILFRVGSFDASLIYYIDIFTMFCTAVTSIVLLKIQVEGFDMRKYVSSILKIVLAVGITGGIVWLCREYVFEKIETVTKLGGILIRIIIITLISLVGLTLTTLFIGFNARQREAAVGKVKTVLSNRIVALLGNRQK